VTAVSARRGVPNAHRSPREWPLGLVLLCAATGFVVIAADHFRRGTAVFAAAVFLAALLRLILPARRAGLLVVRSRGVDVAVLAVLAFGLGMLAVVVPPPP
jgi:hypothetical protein